MTLILFLFFGKKRGVRKTIAHVREAMFVSMVGYNLLIKCFDLISEMYVINSLKFRNILIATLLIACIRDEHCISNDIDHDNKGSVFGC